MSSVDQKGRRRRPKGAPGAAEDAEKGGSSASPSVSPRLAPRGSAPAGGSPRQGARGKKGGRSRRARRGEEGESSGEEPPLEPPPLPLPPPAAASYDPLRPKGGAALGDAKGAAPGKLGFAGVDDGGAAQSVYKGMSSGARRALRERKMLSLIHI